MRWQNAENIILPNCISGCTRSMLPPRRTIVEKNFLRRRRAFDFSHSLGQKRKCPGLRGTPVLPSGTGIISLPRQCPFGPSRPGEFHPEPLTDPDLILSHHPARAIARRLPPSAEISGSSRFDPVGPSSTAITCPLCSTGITPLRHYYRAVRPSPAYRYFRPRGRSRLRLFP